jgi:hypothetical protein
MALKECIRARAAGAIHSHQHVYRKSKLTMALKNSFHLPHARTIVIATVSPASKDTEHSLNTLRHACVMQGEGSGGGDEGSSAGGESRFITGGKMTTEQIGEVNIAQIARKNFEKKKTQGELDGLKTSSGNTLDSKLARAANKEIEITDKMKRKMRRMAENRSFAALDEPIKQIILSSRQKLGQDERQLARIQLSSQFHHLYPDDEDTDPAIPEETNEEEEEDDDEDLDTDQAPAVDDDIDSFHASLPKPEDHRSQGMNNNRKDLKNIDRASLDHKYYEDDFESSTPALQRPGSSSGVANKPNLSHKSVPPNNDGIAASSSQQPQRPTTPSKSIPTPMNVNVSASYSSSSSFARVPYQKIHDSIFIAKDSIPLPILLMQLRAMLQVHNYSAGEIESFILGENGPVKHSRPVTPKIAISVPPVSSSSSQKRSTTPQRPSSASSRQSQSNQYHNNQQQQTPQTMTPRSTERSSRPSSKALPSSSVFVSSGAAAIIGSTASSTRTPSRSNSTSRIRGSEANSNESKGKEKNNNKEDKYQQMKQQYEDELNQKKQRQEQAKQVRDQAEKQKRDHIMAKQQQPNKRSSLENKPLPNEHFEMMQLQKEIDFHSSEAHKLSQQLEKDMLCKDADAKLSMAQKFGVKKQLSLHKAALLKLERKKTEKDSSPVAEPQPQQRQQTPESLSNFGGSNIGMVRNSFGEDDFIVGKRETPTVIETRSSSRGESKPERQRETGSQRYSGIKSFGGYHQEPEEEKGWNFDTDPKSKKVLTKYEVDNEDQDNNNNDHYESNTMNDQRMKNRYPLPAQEDRDDLPVLSEKGRPLSLRMATQYQNRNYSNNY